MEGGNKGGGERRETKETVRKLGKRVGGQSRVVNTKKG